VITSQNLRRMLMRLYKENDATKSQLVFPTVFNPSTMELQCVRGKKQSKSVPHSFPFSNAIP